MVNYLVGTGRGRQCGHREVPGRDRWPSLDTGEKSVYTVTPLGVDIIGCNTGLQRVSCVTLGELHMLSELQFLHV